MLGTAKLIAFVPASDAARAKHFYCDTLGLALVSEDAFALVFESGGTILRVSLVPEVVPARYTILGWAVLDIAAIVRMLQDADVILERFPAMSQDALGIWNSPGGARVAWFKDPDGNVLSITQF
ncbi:MAG TPA: VOC family protein [Bryobacteraceae bacterium]|nr:VOC family protein [Bryobacteraceae bacterium]